MEQIKASFDYLTAVFTQLDDCCDQQSGLRSVPQCSHCPQDVNEFRSFMEANGFVGIEVENLVASTYYDTTGNIREYAEITLELAGEPLNVNEDVIGFLQRMDNAMEGVYGSLYYYDPLDPLCERIMEVVSGTYSLPVAFRESDVSRAASEEVVLEITTIGTVLWALTKNRYSVTQKSSIKVEDKFAPTQQNGQERIQRKGSNYLKKQTL